MPLRGTRRALLASATVDEFSPLDIPDIAFWFDASDASSVTLNGGDVSQINDLSGNGRHAVQGTAGRQPAYTEAAINGLAAIVFTGANDDNLQIGSALGICRNVAAFSFWGVVKPTSFAAAMSFFQILGGTGQNRFVCQAAATSGRLTISSRRLDADTTSAVTSATTAFSAGTAAFVYVGVDYDASSAVVQVNSTSAAVDPAWAGGGNTSDTDSSATPLLGRPTAQQFTGSIGECGAHPRLLTADEIIELRTHCTAKWGTS